MNDSHSPGHTRLEAGTVIADRFIVKNVLGEGGSALVYLAHDRVLDRPVAVKLLGSTASSVVDVARFEREIRMTARLVHPGIVPLFDSGWHETRLYYVMPRVEGITVRQRLNDDGPLPTQQALRLAADVAEALAYAHALGLVHRDIKPENVFMANGRALVADFGVARALESSGAGDTLTADGVAIGTVAYMSPEQAMGERDLDGRADLYSLGCMLVELLSGVPPFRGSTAMHVLAQHLSVVPSLDTLLPDAPPAVITLLAKLLAKNADGRPATAAEVVEELQQMTQVREAPLDVAAPLSPQAAAVSEETAAQRAIAESLALFNRGMQGGEGTADILALARIHAEKALALEPRNVRAMAMLADVIHVRGFRGFDNEADAIAEAQRIRLHAMSIDDTIGELHSSFGVMRLFWQDDFFGAERYLERGAQLAPRDGTARRQYATWLKMAGRFDAALEEMRAAVTIAPDAPHIQVGFGDLLMSMGRHVEAITPLQRALRLVPRYEQALERLEMACHRAGRLDDAYSARRTMLGTRRQLARLDRLTATHDADGWDAARVQDLRAELDEALAMAEHEDPFRDRQTSRQLSDRIIITCGELGEWAQAMEWVERGYYLRPGRLIRVLTDLPFDRRGLASNRRYAPLLRTAGLDFLL